MYEYYFVKIYRAPYKKPFTSGSMYIDSKFKMAFKQPHVHENDWETKPEKIKKNGLTRNFTTEQNKIR